MVWNRSLILFCQWWYKSKHSHLSRMNPAPVKRYFKQASFPITVETSWQHALLLLLQWAPRSHRRAVGATADKPQKFPFITAVCTTDVRSGLRGRFWSKLERAPLWGVLGGSDSGRDQTSGAHHDSSLQPGFRARSGPAVPVSGAQRAGTLEGARRATGETGISEKTALQAQVAVAVA